MKKLGQWEGEMHKIKSQISQKNIELRAQKGGENEKVQLILKFALDVHKIVQTKDDKAYANGIMKLNQEYVVNGDQIQ